MQENKKRPLNTSCGKTTDYGEKYNSKENKNGLVEQEQSNSGPLCHWSQSGNKIPGRKNIW